MTTQIGTVRRPLCRIGLHDFRYHQITYDGLYEYRCKHCGGTA